MKRITGLLLALATAHGLAAQPTNARGWYDTKDIEDVSIGWLQVLSFKEPLKPFAKNGRNYAVSQLEFAKNTVQWWQQSYRPVGLLGEVKQSVLASDTGLAMTDRSWGIADMEKRNRLALPNTYGAYAKMHQCLVKNETHKFYPMPGNHCNMTWDIMANNLELISKQIIAISSPEAYYCILPRYTPGEKGAQDKAWLPAEANYREFLDHPNLATFDHYYIPGGSPVGANGGYYVVIMTKDRKPLPLEQVTVGELLQRLEKNLPLMYTAQLNATKNNPPDYVKTMMEDAKRGLGYLKATYRSRLNEPAFFRDQAHDIMILDLAWAEPGKELGWLTTDASKTDKNGWTTTGVPLLKLKKGVTAACATSDPQWIVFRMTKMIDNSYGGSVGLMDEFVKNFNYDYYYDYYFSGKKASTYTSISSKAGKPAAISATPAAKRPGDKAVLFFEDFSTTATGSTPTGWKLERNNAGNFPTVVEVPGAPGKWLKLQRYAYPLNFTEPISGDFQVSFDLLVRKGDVPWGTPGIQFDLYADGKANSDGSISSKYRFGIDVSPGDMNRKDAAGWVILNAVMPDGYFTCKRESYYSIPDFTGSREVNTVKMAIQRNGDKVSVLCNGKEVFVCEKGISRDIQFNKIRFYVNEKNSYYISNFLHKKIFN